MSLSIDEAKPKLEQAYEHLLEELKKLRTGRAAASMLDGVLVEVYGQTMPLKHMATITVLDAQMLQISPFDPNNLDSISLAIREDKALGLNPADDGKVVRVPIPAMTTERRQDVVKQLNEKVEDANIVLRNVRHEVLNTVKAQLKEKTISEDDYNRADKQMNELMDDYKNKIDELAKNKETEILSL
jgi:ribosome recycling factor